VILARDEAWAKDVQTRVDTAVTTVVRRPGAVEFTRELADDLDPAERPLPTVVAYLADADSRADERLVAALGKARRRLLPVLPLHHPTTRVHEVLPEIVQPLNAKVWDRAEARAVEALLRLLGLIVDERRLFISYARRETSALALQLRTKLSERGYDVFLDRFSVPPADDFQKRLTIELADKAFVVFLETPGAVASKWVEYELAFAHANQLGLLALSLPQTTKSDKVPEAFRYPLLAEDLSGANNGRKLRKDALARVLDEIDTRHARQLRLRRSEMLGSVEDWLGAAGIAFGGTDDEWGIATDWPAGGGSVFLVTPRAPTPGDLRRLDALRRHHDPRGRGYLVYAAPVRDESDEKLLKWIVGRRRLATRLHERVPDLLKQP
jgi:hypothetical protein